MNRILNILNGFFSFSGKSFLVQQTEKSSPNPSEGGGLSVTEEQKLNQESRQLPPLRGGLGWGFFSSISQIAQKFTQTKSSPNPSEGGGLSVTEEQKLKQESMQLPPFRGGLGWGLFSSISQIIQKFTQTNSSPNPSEGGGLASAKDQKLNQESKQLLPFRGGLGWGFFSIISQIAQKFTQTKSSPNPSEGGGLSVTEEQKLKQESRQLPPLRGGLGWGLSLANKQSTNNQQPSIINRQPTANNQQPSTKNRQPKTIPLFVLITLYSLLATALATAQSFPVQVIPQAPPPSPIYISNYADASTVNSPLRVQIILNDFEIANREIRLKTYFESGRLSFQSNDIVVGANTLFLEGGIPLVLTNVNLAPYFQFENINGISPNQYGNAIPEGAYQFCVEVYDALTGSRLSNKSCAVSVVFQNEPPFLVLPINETHIDEINPQYIVFQWTPRSINVSNVEYELSLVEIWDTRVDPQQAFLSSPPVFQTTTSATTYVYGPADPLLLTEKNYAWRVQAKAKKGTEEIGLFKNQGYSEIYSFSYAGSCELPLAINHEVKGSTNANIFWDDFSTEIPEFTVRYRQKNVPDAAWFSAKTTTNELTLWNLKAGTTYEYQLSKKCNITQSDWSFTKTFTTALEFEEESVIDCGVSPDINLTNREPLASIGEGEEFVAGDFPVKILELSGSNGRFTGKGYVKLPYLKNIKVAVEFTNILINTDSEMAEGSVRTVYSGDFDKYILDTDDLVNQVGGIVDSVTNLANAISEALNLDISKDTIEKVNEIVDAIVTNIKNEDLPEELQKSIETAAIEIKDAKERYDEAIANEDSEAAQNAQNDFNTAQDNLEKAQKEVEKYKEEVANLLKKAIVALYREGVANESQLNTDYVEKLAGITTISEVSESETLFFDIASSDTYVDVITDSNTEDFFKIEKKYVSYLFSKMLSEGEDEILQKFIETSLNLQISYAQIVKDSKAANNEEAEIIEKLKVSLQEAYLIVLSNKFEKL